MLNLAAAQRILFPEPNEALNTLAACGECGCETSWQPWLPLLHSVCSKLLSICCRICSDILSYLTLCMPQIYKHVSYSSLSLPNSLSPLSHVPSLLLASLLTHYFEINVASFARQAREFLLPSTWQPPFLLSLSVSTLSVSLAQLLIECRVLFKSLAHGVLLIWSVWICLQFGNALSACFINWANQ